MSVSFYSVLTACTTFGSAVSYLTMRDTYKFSHREYDHQFGKKLTAFIIYVGFNVAFFFFVPTKDKIKEKPA